MFIAEVSSGIIAMIRISVHSRFKPIVRVPTPPNPPMTHSTPLPSPPPLIGLANGWPTQRPNSPYLHSTHFPYFTFDHHPFPIRLAVAHKYWANSLSKFRGIVSLFSVVTRYSIFGAPLRLLSTYSSAQLEALPHIYSPVHTRC